MKSNESKSSEFNHKHYNEPSTTIRQATFSKVAKQSKTNFEIARLAGEQF